MSNLELRPESPKSVGINNLWPTTLFYANSNPQTSKSLPLKSLNFKKNENKIWQLIILPPVNKPADWSSFYGEICRRCCWHLRSLFSLKDVWKTWVLFPEWNQASFHWTCLCESGSLVCWSISNVFSSHTADDEASSVSLDFLKTLIWTSFFSILEIKN